MRHLWFVLIMILFGGCAKYVETNVSVFHDMNTQPRGITYAIVPGKEQSESLEFQSYARMLKSELDRQGMIEVPEKMATYTVYMSYGVDSGRMVYSSTPVYGQTGLWGTFSTGSIVKTGSGATYTGVTLATPSYGIVGSETHGDLMFSRFLSIDIVDMRSGTHRKVYEAKALSIGETGMLISIIPLMIQSVFEDFPGQSGTTRVSKKPLVEKK